MQWPHRFNGFSEGLRMAANADVLPAPSRVGHGMVNTDRVRDHSLAAIACDTARANNLPPEALNSHAEAKLAGSKKTGL